VVLAGNATIQAAADAGITHVQVVEADGQTVVAVRRRGLTPHQKAQLAIYDNRAAELADGWDVEVLQALEADGVDLSAFWQEDELAALYAAEQIPTVGQTDPDAVPAERHTDIRVGDVCALGRHRLVCGDARQMATVEAAMAGPRADGMWTDPPFGVSYVGKTSEALVVHGDAEADLAPLLRDAFAAVDRVLKPGAAIYVAHPAGRNAVVFGQAFLAAGWHFHQGLVWVKDVMVLGHSDFQYQHESIIYGWKTGAPHTWLSDRTQVTVFAIDRPKASPDHPTSKPVALILQQIGHNVPPGGVILEPFGGSGSTLIAAEQLGISCRAVELSPAYCQVIVDRFEAFTGQRAVKVGAVHACQGEE
jgi:site-specific DNA-methyltransferase (adenine-specific)